MTANIPVIMVEDSKLLLALQEDDEGFPDNLTNERVLSAIKIVRPMYEYDGYERGLDDDSLVLLILELNYLGCTRLEEVLVMVHFKSGAKHSIIERLSEDIQRYAESMKYQSTEIQTYIENGMLCAVKSYTMYHPIVSDEDFVLSCSKGHLSIAQWLYGVGGVNIHANDENAFQNACGNGHILLAKWLYEIGGVDIHANNDFAFRWACAHGHLAIAQWLYGLGGVDIHANKDSSLKHAKYYNRTLVIRWLESLMNGHV